MMEFRIYAREPAVKERPMLNEEAEEHVGGCTWLYQQF